MADIIFGKVNPSENFQQLFPKRIEDTPAFGCYPGENSQMDYEEKLLVGHRWYEKKNIKPLFPFWIWTVLYRFFLFKSGDH